MRGVFLAFHKRHVFQHCLCAILLDGQAGLLFSELLQPRVHWSLLFVSLFFLFCSLQGLQTTYSIMIFFSMLCRSFARVAKLFAVFYSKRDLISLIA